MISLTFNGSLWDFNVGLTDGVTGVFCINSFSSLIVKILSLLERKQWDISLWASMPLHLIHAQSYLLMYIYCNIWQVTVCASVPDCKLLLVGSKSSFIQVHKIQHTRFQVCNILMYLQYVETSSLLLCTLIRTDIWLNAFPNVVQWCNAVVRLELSNKRSMATMDTDASRYVYRYVSVIQSRSLVCA